MKDARTSREPYTAARLDAYESDSPRLEEQHQFGVSSLWLWAVQRRPAYTPGQQAAIPLTFPATSGAARALNSKAPGRARSTAKSSSVLAMKPSLW